METLDSCSSRIDHKHITHWVAHDLKYMRMTTYENIRAIFIDQFPGFRIITSRIAADMYHEYLHALTLEESVERMDKTQFMIVTIARHPQQWLECGDLLCQPHAPSEVSGMPYLVDRGKKLLETGVKDAMGIRYQSYVHDQSFMNIFFR